MEKSLQYALGLRVASGHNNRLFFQLVKTFGSIEEAWKAKTVPLEKACKVIEGFNAKKFIDARNNLDLEELSAGLEKSGIGILVVGTPQYPELLATIPDSPPVLFVRGKYLDKINNLCVGVVGARRATGYGRDVAEGIASELGKQNITVVSGLARGIDTASHKGALSTPGGTIAVLGCGLDVCYPPENRKLAHQIADEGVLISEYMPKTPPLAYNFPARNRIISGLCEAIVVVEANERSGALITAEFALEHGREVFAVPGSVRNALSKGPHKLLREGASLVETAQDILLELGILAEPVKEHVDLKSSLDKDEQAIFNLIEHEPIHIEDIIGGSGYSPAHVSGILTMLELKGYLQKDEGNFFLRA